MYIRSRHWPVISKASGRVRYRLGLRLNRTCAHELKDRGIDEVDALRGSFEAWQQAGSRRMTRSAVLRRAIEHLREAVETDPAKFLLEGD